MIYESSPVELYWEFKDLIIKNSKDIRAQILKWIEEYEEDYL